MTDTPEQPSRSRLGNQLRQIVNHLQGRDDWIMVTARLAQIYQRYRHLLWPDGDAAATNAYIESNLLAIIETLARLFDEAAAQEQAPLAWYDAMAPLLAEIEGLAHGDASHNATRAELCRLLIQRKSDLGLADRDDAEIVERIDDDVWHLWQRVALAAHTGDDAFVARFGWLVAAFGRLQGDQPAVKLDG